MFTKYARIIMALTVMITGLLAPMRIELVVGQEYVEPRIQIVENTASAQSITTNGELNCSWTDVPCGIAYIIGSLLTFVTGLLSAISGLVMDFFLAYSINSTTYQDTTGFITDSWTIVRDFTNIAFVFAFLFIGIALILDIDIKGSNPRKLFANVILIALLMNFSLFFTRFVIDAGNILANVFYNNMDVSLAGGGGNATIGQILTAAQGNQDVRSVGLALSSKVNVQSILSQSPPDGSNVLTMYLFISLMVGILNLGMVYIFISVMFLFLLRIVMLWLYMITSPIAFISTIIPGGTGWKYVGFKSWSDGLINQSFLAPVFLFFMYIIISFLSDPDLAVIGQSESIGLIPALLNTIFPFAILFGLLWFSRSIALSMSGEMGQKISGVATMVAGGAVALGAGAALGGAALAGRATVGRAGAAISNSSTLRQLSTGNMSKIDAFIQNRRAQGGAVNNAVASVLQRGTSNRFVRKAIASTADVARDTGQNIGSKTFDIRNTETFGIGKGISKYSGQQFQSKKGFIQAREEKDKKKIEKQKKKARDLRLDESSPETQELRRLEQERERLNRENNEDMRNLRNSPEGINYTNAREARENADTNVQATQAVLNAAQERVDQIDTNIATLMQQLQATPQNFPGMPPRPNPAYAQMQQQLQNLQNQRQPLANDLTQATNSHNTAVQNRDAAQQAEDAARQVIQPQLDTINDRRRQIEGRNGLNEGIRNQQQLITDTNNRNLQAFADTIREDSTLWRDLGRNVIDSAFSGIQAGASFLPYIGNDVAQDIQRVGDAFNYLNDTIHQRSIDRDAVTANDIARGNVRTSSDIDRERFRAFQDLFSNETTTNNQQTPRPPASPPAPGPTP